MPFTSITQGKKILYYGLHFPGWWFSPGTPTSSTNKTDRHNITEILLSDIKHHNPNLAQVLVTIFAFLEILVITCESYCFSFTKIKKSKLSSSNFFS
jgi:hypothetical protein